MRIREKKQHMSGVLVLLLFAVFAVCLMMVLLTGAGVYQRTVERDLAGYEVRTARQYLASRVRQSDRADSVMVSSFTWGEGDDTLTLTQYYEGDVYYTRLYVYDGYLRELFCAAEDTFLPEDGEKVLPAGDVSFSYEEKLQLLTVALTDAEGAEENIVLHLRSGEGAAQ